MSSISERGFVLDPMGQWEGTLNDVIQTLQKPDVILTIMGVSVLVLFVLAASNRVVVFASLSDMFWTTSLILTPIITVLIVSITRPASSAGINMFTMAFATQFPAQGIMVAAGVAFFGFALLTTIVGAISYNGLVLGTIVAVFKIFSSVFLLVAFPLTWFVANLEGSRSAYTPIRWAVYGFLGWIGYVLINGERVMTRREALLEGD